ncbi:MAG: cytochrome c [Myxococcota bacterium]
MGWRMVAACVLLLSCGDGNVVSPSRGQTLRPVVSTLLSETPTLAVALDDGRVLAETSEGLLLLRSPEDEGVIVGATGELGELRTVASVDGSTLLVGSGGVFVLRDEAFFVSPLAEALGEETVLGIVGTPREGVSTSDLWILTDQNLYLFRDDRLSPVEVDGVVFEGGVIASAPLLRGRSVWVATGEQVLELWMRDEGLQVARVRTGALPSQMVADGQGRLWILDVDGDLYALDSRRRLLRYAMGFEVTAIRASVAGPDLWIRGAEGERWHHADGEFHVVEGSMDDLDAGPDGALLAVAEGSLNILRARQAVRLLGPEAGARLVEATEIAVDAPSPDSVESIEAFVDGASVPVEDGVVRFLPDELSSGAHNLRVVVRYSDGTLPVSLERVYQVGLEAAWATDVLPIFDAWCAECHAAGGPAPTRLDTRELFAEEVDRVIFNIREGRMPLGRDPLDPDVVAVIEAWAASGFPE